MKKVRITVMRTARYDDLIERYENPIPYACNMRESQVFTAVMTLAHGGEDFKRPMGR